MNLWNELGIDDGSGSERRNSSIGYRTPEQERIDMTAKVAA